MAFIQVLDANGVVQNMHVSLVGGDNVPHHIIGDGTNATSVKAASTAALAADPSLVIAFSPNSPLPAGTAVIGHVIVDSGTITGTINTKTLLTVSSPTFATVGVASALALATNANRKGLVLVNTSNNFISIAFGVAAVLNSGITLAPGGGSFTMDEYTFSTAAINAIAGGAASNLGIQEFTT